MEEEERIYWAERRRFEEEMDDMNIYRRFPPGGRGGGPGHPPPGLMGSGGRFGPPGAPPMGGPGGPPMPLFGGGPPHHHHPHHPPPHHLHPYMMRRPDTLEDRHCMAKHEQIYPAEGELEAIQRIVAHAESALKKVSDHLAAQVTQRFAAFMAGLRIRIRIGSGFNGVSGSGSVFGIRIRVQEGKNDPQK